MTTAGERTRARGQALRRLAEALSRTATPAGIGRLTITDAAAVLGADAASVYTTGPPGSGSLDLAHYTGWPAELAERYRVLPLTAGRPLSDAVLGREPVWLEDGDQWLARYPAMAPVHSAGGYQATACLPLVVEDRDLGAAVFSFVRPRVFDAEEREFLTAVAALCAQALDRARLYTAERAARAAAERDRDRMRFLAEAGLLLEAPLSVEERMHRLAGLVVPDIADWCAVHLVRDGRVEQVAVAHADPAKVAHVTALQERYPPDPDAPHGAIQVARTGVPTHIREIDDALLVAAARDATHLELIRTLGMRSALVVPLQVRGTSLGALTLVQAESGALFEAEDLSFAGQIARAAALAIDNARLYEEQQRIAHTLQAALLPAVVPEVAGLRVAARYRPRGGADGATVGGDAYDVFPGARPGEWAVLVADVCGKGPEAAAVTALIRHTVRAEVGHGLTPAQVLLRLNAAMLAQAGGARFATAVLGRLHIGPDGVRVGLANAGHLEPLVVRTGGVERVAARGTLLGVFADVALTEVAVHLRPGEALVLCTDGVTEARGDVGCFGADRLTDRLTASVGRPAERLADDLLDEVLAFQGGRPGDDIAILVLEAAS